MSSKSIFLGFNYKQLCILTHSLRDKKKRDKDEEKLYLMLRDEVDQFKLANHIVDKPYKP